MKKILTALLATVALAIPASALAHDGHGGHHGHHGRDGGIRLASLGSQQGDVKLQSFDSHKDGVKFEGAGMHHGFGHHHAASLAKLTGTGSSFSAAAATASGTLAGSGDLATGTFSANLTSDPSTATTKTSDHGTLSCASSTATLTVVGAVAANNATSSLTGKTCTWTKTDGTTFRAFFGKGSVTGAGTLAALTGSTEKAFLVQKADGTVSGSVFAGSMGDPSTGTLSLFSTREHAAAHKTGDCDGKANA